MKRITPRAICLEILNRIERADRHLDGLLNDSFKRYRHLSSLDKRFLTELAYGTLRWREKLDWVLARFSNLPLDKIEPNILNILRVGLYQILFLSRTPVSAAVNESVELAKKSRGKGGGAFVNAILRSVLREKEVIPYPDPEKDPPRYVSVVHSHPFWLVKRWAEEMGVEEGLKACEKNNQISPLTLRTNTLKIDREDLIRRFVEYGLKPIPTFYSNDGIVLEDPPPTSELPFLKAGFYMIQNEASQLVTSILDPKPGEKVLDACAAPGGKTTHMAQQMRNEGSVYAVDLTREKLRMIEDICLRLGITIVNAIKGDARHPIHIPDGLKFDRILADVPCSGFGTLRRNPDLKWRRKEEDIKKLSKLQSSILRNVAGYVKNDGILVYSTCTVFPEENEDVVKGFLNEHPEFQPDRMDNVLPERCRSLIRNGYFKTFPLGDGMDGFFVARLARKDGR